MLCAAGIARGASLLSENGRGLKSPRPRVVALSAIFQWQPLHVEQCPLHFFAGLPVADHTEPE